MNMETPDNSPAVYSIFKHSQLATASVEKSFSIQQKLLAKYRNFKIENVKQYIILGFILLHYLVY